MPHAIQFKPTIKSICKIWVHKPLFFEVLQVFYKLHEARCKDEATHKNSRNVGKFWPFFLKKQAFSRKIGAVMPIFEETYRARR